VHVCSGGKVVQADSSTMWVAGPMRKGAAAAWLAGSSVVLVEVESGFLAYGRRRGADSVSLTGASVARAGSVSVELWQNMAPALCRSARETGN
jgi:hypothetical protein